MVVGFDGSGGKSMRLLLLALAAWIGLGGPSRAFDAADLARLKAGGGCTGCELAGARLSDAGLAGADLTGADQIGRAHV